MLKLNNIIRPLSKVSLFFEYQLNNYAFEGFNEIECSFLGNLASIISMVFLILCDFIWKLGMARLNNFLQKYLNFRNIVLFCQ
jgi:hypothetical protein